MGRLNTMTDLTASASIISAATYDPASRLLSITGTSYNESRSYNVMGQLISLTSNLQTMTYSYSATQNNGKITGMVNGISGEAVVYAYDALNRLKRILRAVPGFQRLTGRKRGTVSSVPGFPGFP